MLLGPMFAAVIMSHNLWAPLWTGVVLIIVVLPLLRLVRPPNPAQKMSTTSSTQHDDGEDLDRAPLLHDDPTERPESTLHEGEEEEKRQAFQAFPPSRHALTDFFTAYLNLLQASRNFRLVLLAKFLSSFASSSSAILALYITMRTGWTFAEVSSIN